jgi:hypothetical protein
MKISVEEYQMIVSTIIMLPATILLLVLFFTGKFTKIENVKYIVTNEEDFIASDNGHKELEESDTENEK